MCWGCRSDQPCAVLEGRVPLSAPLTPLTGLCESLSWDGEGPQSAAHWEPVSKWAFGLEKRSLAGRYSCCLQTCEGLPWREEVELFPVGPGELSRGPQFEQQAECGSGVGLYWKLERP